MKTLADLFLALDDRLSDELKAMLMQISEQHLWKLHLGVSPIIKGLTILRNPYNEGRAYFASLGREDEVSELLGELYWRHLQSRDLREVEMVRIIKARLYSTPQEMRTVARDLASSYLDYRRRSFAGLRQLQLN